MEMFYKANFDGPPEEVFKRFCKFHDLDEEEILGLYRSTLKWNLIYPSNSKQNLTEELENLSEIFLRLL